ncbi:MAG: hypothetical protein KDD42_05510 [Bdellovibrionales bacterium]|nr:hypothetical protein [Bdellovibrionales bacterium]
MTNKIKGKKGIKEVVSTERTGVVEGTDAVKSVETVKGAGAVGASGSAGRAGRRGATRTMTLAERQELLRMINEEADKLLEHSGMSAAKKKQVVEAVKMAVDVGISEEDLE